MCDAPAGAGELGGHPVESPRAAFDSARCEIDALLVFFERVACALHVAHEAGVVHRDIKPGNIMVQPDGNPAIFDFGLACFEEPEGSRITRSHETFGTPAYMAPEQFEERAIEPDRRCDLFSLGVTLYECATGRRPHGDGPRVRLLQAIRNRDRPAAERSGAAGTLVWPPPADDNPPAGTPADSRWRTRTHAGPVGRGPESHPRGRGALPGRARLSAL